MANSLEPAAPKRSEGGPLPSGGRNREEIAKAEIARTAVTPATARLLLAIFLVVICSAAILEWPIVRESIRFHFGQSRGLPPPTGMWQRLVSANRDVLSRMNAFERALENDSLLARALRPPLQIVLTRWLGAGNERVYPGEAGWLFYRPDVEYITGPGFLARPQLERRVAAGPEWDAPPQPDPRHAVGLFARDLKSRGITLIVMPTPLKPVIHPEMLASRYGNRETGLQNPSYRTFVDDLTANGVLVFDPSVALAGARRIEPQYLATDSHWRPESMEAVAELLGSFIGAHVRLPDVPDPRYHVERVEVRSRGDIARMLDLPDDDEEFVPEAVWVRRILQSDGRPWRPSAEADVLVLGDSFSNIYTLESMGWGTSAGFVEQLSYALRRPVDRLVQNDEGAFATRAMLQQNRARLAAKRVVIYQFAMRELAFGDWKVLPLQ